VLDRHGTEFDERNLLLHLTLGLLGLGRRLDALLDAHAPELAPSQAEASPEIDLENDRLLLFALGLVSFQQKLRGHAGRVPGVPRGDPGVAPGRELTGLLR